MCAYVFLSLCSYVSSSFLKKFQVVIKLCCICLWCMADVLIISLLYHDRIEAIRFIRCNIVLN